MTLVRIILKFYFFRSLTENVVNENGNLIFSKDDRAANINDVAEHNYDKKPSPTMSSKSINSYKGGSNPVRRESASESESGNRRKYG